MSVSLRIVGIYYHQDKIPYKENMTVMDVLNYARENQVKNAKVFGFETGQLQFGADAGKPSITSFYSEYEEPFQSKTSGYMKPAGPYFLPEDISTSPSFTAWQYYVFSKPLQEGGAVYQVNDPRIESFVDAKVPDGGFVTWRLCKILGSPQEMPANKMGAMSKLV
ncbi:MAG: hypothetical protein JJ858_06615 [Rhizobiaceae bacterium]|nr:hypothetical protein [Rhizobiaceae bacterium]